MRAFVQRGFGAGGDVVGFESVPDPEPGPGEVVVRVHACALNRLDLLQRDAALVRGFSLPHIAGMDVAGEVVARHADLIGGPAIGDRVIVDPVSTCGTCDRCTNGLAPYCEQLRTIGSTRPGGFAELVAAPASTVHPLPDGLTFVEAATLPVAAMTAFHALQAGGHVPGETVLVNGAASGVSCAALALLRADGSTVITTTGGAAKVARAQAVGYHHVIDYLQADGGGTISPIVLELTGGRGVDLVIDHVGPALFAPSIRSMAIGGRMVFCGTTTGTEATISLTDVYHWGRTLIGAGGYQPTDFPKMLAAMAATGSPPVIDSTWPFDELPAALDHMARGEFFGKIIVTMN